MTMKTVVNVSCDGENCDHVRASDSNHWLVGIVIEDLISISTSRDKIPTNKIVPKSRAPYGLPDNIVKDFCGEECAIKWVSKQLTEIKLK